jgi:hypothetical protein
MGIRNELVVSDMSYIVFTIDENLNGCFVRTNFRIFIALVS